MKISVTRSAGLDPIIPHNKLHFAGENGLASSMAAPEHSPVQISIMINQDVIFIKNNY